MEDSGNVREGQFGGEGHFDSRPSFEAFFPESSQCSFKDIGDGGGFTEEDGSRFGDGDLSGCSFEELEAESGLDLGDLSAESALGDAGFEGRG